MNIFLRQNGRDEGGYWELIDLSAKHKTDLGGFNLEVYGNGKDTDEVQSTAKRLNLDVNVMKVEMIHMILFMVLRSVLPWLKLLQCGNLDQPSDEIFPGIPEPASCLTYTATEDFVAKFKEVMSSKPQPLTPEEQYKLATQRFMEHSDLDKVLISETRLGRRR